VDTIVRQHFLAEEQAAMKFDYNYPDANLVVPALLFLLLLPGLFFVLPLGAAPLSTAAVTTHTLLFSVALLVIRRTFPLIF
jgi:hypothetical protein